MRKVFITTVSVLAMLSAPAFADDLDLAGVLTGSLNHITGSKISDVNNWGVDGAAKLGLGSYGLNAEINVGYNRAAFDGMRAQTWNTGGSLFMAVEQGRVGINVNYNELNALGLNNHYTSFGGFGDYYVDNALTVTGKLGGFSGDANGLYIGAGATGYVLPNLALSGLASFTNVNKGYQATELGVQGEYLFSEEIPVSAFTGYTFSAFSDHGGNAHTFFVGLRVYTNTVGGTSLVDRHRSGTVSSIAKFSPALIAGSVESEVEEPVLPRRNFSGPT